METARLVIAVDSSDANKATRALDKLDRAAGGSERAANKLGKAWGVAVGLISSAVIIGATRSFIRQADAFANMSARIGLVTDSGAELVKVQKQLFALSQQTSSDIEGTTDLYVKLAQSSDALRNNQSLLLRTTELVSKSLVVSGTEAAGAAATIRQFSQAMGAGALRGDEFISIMENAPRLAQAIADGMGVARGELREMAKDGKLTAEAVVAAIESQGEAIDREFGQMPLTVSRATQQVKNALTQMIGETDKATGASADLAESIANLARTLESDSVKNGFGAILGFIADVASVSATAIGKMNELWAKAQQFATFAAGGTADVSDLQQIRFELEQLEGVEGRRAANRRKELRGMESMSLMLFGDPSQTRVNMITGSSGSLPDSAFRAGSSSSGAGGAGGGVGGDDKAAASLQKAYEGLSASLREQLALHGLVGKAAEVRYAVEQGELSALAPAKKAELLAYAEEIDAKEKLAAIEEVWAEAAADAVVRRGEHTEAIARGRAATDLLISDMEFELSLIGLSNVEREKAIALRYAGVDAMSVEGRSIGNLIGEIERGREAEGYINDLKGGMADLFMTIGKGSDAATASFERMIDSLKRRAAEALADNAINGLIEGFASLMTGGGWSGFASGFAKGWSDSDGGGRAGGGPVMAGQSYLVGEKGPEVVTLGGNGRVTPMSALNASTGDIEVVVNVTNNGQPVQAQQTGTRREGNKVIADLVLNTVREGMARGELDGAAGQAWGVQRRGFR